MTIDAINRQTNQTICCYFNVNNAILACYRKIIQNIYVRIAHVFIRVFANIAHYTTSHTKWVSCVRLSTTYICTIHQMFQNVIVTIYFIYWPTNQTMSNRIQCRLCQYYIV